jgi:lysozyme family protein
MNEFDTIFERLFAHEGGYVNDPADPGGETKYGISKRSYPRVDIRNLTREDAKDIYRRDFWEPLNLDGLSFAVKFQLCDFAVNSGIGTAIRYLQRAIGVADDGVWGPHSKSVALTISEPDLIMILIAERMIFQTKLKNWPDHGKGWTVRNAQNLRIAAKDTIL